jgi:hypothetical protein
MIFHNMSTRQFCTLSFSRRGLRDICTIVLLYNCTYEIFFRLFIFCLVSPYMHSTILPYGPGIAESISEQLHPIVFKLGIRETIMSRWLTRW